MGRPRKWKRVCGLPPVESFSGGWNGHDAPILLNVEEYEAIRLIDLEDMAQEEGAAQMEVSRPTVQLLYNSARKKVAQFLVGGGRLEIAGGDYRICGSDGPRGEASRCHHRHCCKKHGNCPH